MSPESILLSLLGAAGIFLIYSAFTARFQANLGTNARDRLRPVTDATSPAAPDTPFLDRALAPFLQSLGHLMARFFRNPDHDEMRIRAAGRPKRFHTIYDLYAWKAFQAILFFMFGLVLALIIGPAAIVVALGLGVFGMYLPDMTLSQLITKRTEAIRTEMAFTYHRLAVHVAAGRTLQQAIEAITEGPGGAWIQELRAVPRAVSAAKPFSEAMEDLRYSCPGIQEVGRFVDLVARHQRMGTSLQEVLQSTGRLMQDRVQQDIEARAWRPRSK